MKLARLLFIVVLLASAVLVPTKPASAVWVEPAPSVVVNTDVQLVPVGGWVEVSVVFRPDGNQKQDVPAEIVIKVDNLQLFKDVKVTQGALTMDVNRLALVWKGTLKVGSLGETLKFKLQAGSLPVGTNAPINYFPVKVTATVNSIPNTGTIPSTSASLVFTIYNPAVAGFVINVNVDPVYAKAGDKLTVTVTFNSTEATLRDQYVDVTVTFAKGALVKNLTVITPPSPIGTAADEANKKVTWTGKLLAGGRGPITIQFTVIAVAPAGAMDLASVVDTASANFQVEGVDDAAYGKVEASKSLPPYVIYLPTAQFGTK